MSTQLFPQIQRIYTDGCPTDFADLHGYYSVGLTKTDINPLKRMEAELSVRLPLLSYKSKLLTPKRKPDSTFLQKAYILFKAINRK